MYCKIIRLLNRVLIFLSETHSRFKKMPIIFKILSISIVTCSLKISLKALKIRLKRFSNKGRNNLTVQASQSKKCKETII